MVHQHTQRPNLQSVDDEVYDVIELVAITMMSLSLSPGNAMSCATEGIAKVQCEKGPCSEVAVHVIGSDWEEFDSVDVCGEKGSVS